MDNCHLTEGAERLKAFISFYLGTCGWAQISQSETHREMLQSHKTLKQEHQEEEDVKTVEKHQLDEENINWEI